jgi:hypothetical protein
VEVVAAAVGVESAEQAVPLDHLAQPAQSGGGALLGDEKGREDGAGRVVERDDEIAGRLARQPDMPRGVLMQHHADQRPPRPLLAVRRAPRRRPDQPGLLQVQLGDRVAELVAVPLLQLLVEVFHRELGIAAAVELEHACDLAHAGTPR